MSGIETQLEISDAKMPEIKKMMNAFGLKTWKDFLNFCLNLSARCLERASEGKAIGAYNRKDNTFLEVLSPALDHARMTNISLKP